MFSLIKYSFSYENSRNINLFSQIGVRSMKSIFESVFF